MTKAQRTKLNEMLWEYFGLELPDEFVDSVVRENPTILIELDAGAIRDTCVRDETIDTILKKLSMRSWPTYGDTYKDCTVQPRFLAELKEKVIAIGGNICLL